MPSNSRYGADLGGRSDPNPNVLDGELPPLGANESLLGSHIALRSITNIGNTAGLLLSGSLPPTWTRYVDLTALTGASFLKHDRFELKYSGSAVFVPSSLPGSPVEGEFVYTAAGHQFQFWNGSAWVGLSSGSTGVASITGTANQVTVTPTTGNAIASLPSTIILPGTLSLPGQLTSTLASGTAPFVVASTTAVANLNADLLDGIDGSNYTRKDLTFLGATGSIAYDSVTDTAAEWSALPVGYARMMANTIGTAGGAPVNAFGYLFKSANRDTLGGWVGIWLGHGAGSNNYIGRTDDNTAFATWSKIWTDVNDGAGSTLDADLLDGQDSTFYQNASNLNAGNLAYARLPTGGGTWANGGALSITGGVTTVAGLTSSAAVLAGTDNSFDLGAAGASRFRTGYFAASVIVGADPGGFGGVIRASGGIDIGGSISMIGTGVEQDFKRTTNALNEKTWNWFPSTTTFSGRALSDDRLTGNNWIQVTRSGISITTINFPNGVVIVGTDPGGAEILRVGGAARLNGALVWQTDNSFDVGASLATRPRTGYFGTSVVVSTDTTLSNQNLGQTTNTATFQLAGGTGGGSGNIILYGGAHATNPNEIRFRQGTTVVGTFLTGTGAFIVGTDPGSTETVRIGGTLRVGNTTGPGGGALVLSNTAASGANLIQGAGGRIDNMFYDSAAALDEKRWDISVDGVAGAKSFSLLTRSDAGVAGTQFLRAFRTANAIDRVEIATGTVQVFLDTTLYPNSGSPGLGKSTNRWQKLWGVDADFTSDVTLGGRILFTTAASKIVPGATSLSLRNNADSADNLILLDAGDATLRTKLTMPGPLTFTAAASQIIPGATSFALRNNANNANNLILTDAGAATFRNDVSIGTGRLLMDVSAGNVDRVAQFGSGGSTLWHLGITDTSGTALTFADGAVPGTVRFKITKTTGLVETINDFKIATLGTFDSTDTPTDNQLLLYHAGSTNKWQAETLQLIYNAGDAAVGLLVDNTSVAYVYLDPGTGADSPAGAPPVPVIKLFRSHKAITVQVLASAAPDIEYHDGASFPADFRHFIYEYSTDAFGTAAKALATATSDKVVHGRLTAGTTYSYRVRAIDKFGNASANSSVVSVAATSNSDTSAFGILLASEIVVDRLAALSSDIGIMTAGQLRNTGNTSGVNLGGAGGIPGTWTSGINFESAAGAGSMTRYINFTATGANPVFKHELLSLNADGSAVFNGIVRDTSSKFTIDMSTAGVRLMTIIDEQGSPKTRVKLGEISTGTTDWGLQLFADNGNKIVELSGTTMFLQDSAATPTQGINIQGTLPGTWTRYLNLNGSGAMLHHDKLDLNYDGSAKFKGILDITDPAGQALPFGVDAAIILRDPDVAHGITTILPTDSYGIIGPANDTNGGMFLVGITDTNNTSPMTLLAVSGSTAPIVPIFKLTVAKKNGTATQALSATEEAFRLDVGGGGTTLLSIYGDGSQELLEQTAPGTPAANRTRDYAKDVSGISTRYWKDDAGNEHPHNLTLIDTQTITATGAFTWTKPAGAVLVRVVVIAAGGGGAGGEGKAAANAKRGGSGGGGGAMDDQWFRAPDLGSTEAGSVGAGGTNGTGGVNAAGTDATAGGDSWFGNATQASAKTWAYGGGGGINRSGLGTSGGGGGGRTGAGAAGGSAANVPGGQPVLANAVDNTGFGGGGSTADGNGNFAIYGGGGGGGAGSITVAGRKGATSHYAAGGAGGGGSVTVGDVALAGGDGGDNKLSTTGGGGTGGAATGAAGAAGANGDNFRCGKGGGGGGGNSAGTGGVGGAGGTMGGGGGGGGAGTSTGGNGGVGGRGEVRVYSYA